MCDLTKYLERKIGDSLSIEFNCKPTKYDEYNKRRGVRIYFDILIVNPKTQTVHMDIHFCELISYSEVKTVYLANGHKVCYAHENSLRNLLLSIVTLDSNLYEKICKSLPSEIETQSISEVLKH